MGNREYGDYGQWFICVKKLIGMHERGLYGSSLEKKRKHWPKVIYGDQINDHFE